MGIAKDKWKAELLMANVYDSRPQATSELQKKYLRDLAEYYCGFKRTTLEEGLRAVSVEMKNRKCANLADIANEMAATIRSSQNSSKQSTNISATNSLY